MRFVYVKCDKKELLNEVEDWMKDTIDIHNLEDFCSEELQVCHLYPENWIAFEKFKSKFEGVDIDYSKVKSGDAYIKVKEDKVHYLVRVLEYKKEGSAAPLSFVKKDIYSILINRKKTEFINSFQKELLANELDNGNVKVLD